MLEPQVGHTLHHYPCRQNLRSMEFHPRLKEMRSKAEGPRQPINPCLDSIKYLPKQEANKELMPSFQEKINLFSFLIYSI